LRGFHAQKGSNDPVNQTESNSEKVVFEPGVDTDNANPKRCAYVRLKIDWRLAKKAKRKPTRTQSNQIKPNHTCRRVESSEKGRWNTGRPNPVEPQKAN
jgi:predicted RNA-binding protein YlxR (DUF448 family)